MDIGIMALLVITIMVIVLFTLTNGLHDASSVVATFITCGAATPGQAVVFAAIFELLGAILGGSAVAGTVAGIVKLQAGHEMLVVILAAVVGAVTWNLLTWKFGIPSSSTHALIGGLSGAALGFGGRQMINWGFVDAFYSLHLTGIAKVLFALVFSPFLGLVIAYLMLHLLMLAFRNATYKVNVPIKKTQWILTAIMAFNHGANDTQKSMGLFMLALFSAGKVISISVVPMEIRVLVGIVMCLGVLFGGWSIMKTLGRGIFTIRPVHSLASQLGTGISLYIANVTGAPVSTTHVVVGTIMGVGTAAEKKMVNWHATKNILFSWVITIPCSGAVSWLFFKILNLFIGGI